ncbi:DNA segregation ATPase FtsK/SpoIIIE, S-DNA-T family [Xylanibacter ruminicola]|uniref:DNA segregation ATPase FtsK/SpoIIIE, S-DNA-T family n=2 Tax=Xylanibacter ruminicola TaxID=839 RepID=A0A1M6V147_XYLRU|nr:DNA segregation ATPase FtsK/SpoIIIE, S-DNA-T family [Xylanibacter ruminicola]
MMKSYFFQLLLHENIINCMKKVKKKSTNNDNKERLSFILGAILFGISIYLCFAFVSYFSTGAADQTLIEEPRDGEVLNEHHEFANTCGSLGAYASWFLIKRCFGLPAFLIPLLLFVAAIHLMKAYRVNLLKWCLSVTLLMIWASVALATFLQPLFVDSSFCPGGDHGMYISHYIGNLVGAPGLTAILALIAVAFLTYFSAATVIFIRKMLNPTLYINKVKFTVAKPSDNTDDIESEPEENLVFDDPGKSEVIFDDKGGAVVIDEGYRDEDSNIKEGPVVKQPKPEITDTKNTDEIGMEVEVAKGDTETANAKTLVEDVNSMEPYDPKRDLENYHYPTLDLLKKYDNDGKPYIDMAEQTANKNRIVEVLRTFGVEISSIKATVGPTITLYEITLAQGVRIQKVKNLEDDIALSLAALGIRIIAPMPGKGTVGIEVPNAKPSTVSMESILNSKKFQESKMELPCAIGKTITNEVFMFDLAKAPHLLVAGATGQGKSVGLNAIITSLLYKKHPAELKIVLVDPKKVEFSFYEPIANHFLAKVPDEEADPIITDVSKVVRTLNSLCKEMDSRYDLLKSARAHNIKEYNQKFIARQLNPNNGHRFLPYIVVVIDEFGDLIMTAGKEVELPIARIAQLARAVGIHMIIATQRPTTNIITGTIKANFPSRIAFKVSAGIDSKTILDRTGAQQLIGRGDMLALVGGSEPERVQCAFVDTPEVERINEYISDQQSYGAPFELPEPDMPEADMGDGGDKDVDMAHLDPLFDDAARLIVVNQSGSTSLIQRKFAIGYNRAGRLMDQLERAGVVGAAMGSKPREVLIQDENSLNNLLNSLR